MRKKVRPNKYKLMVFLSAFSIFLLVVEIVIISKQNVSYYKQLLDFKNNQAKMMSAEYNSIPRKTQVPEIPKKRFKWPDGAKAAISLSYDDGYKSHYNYVAQLLAKKNLKATFYPTVFQSVINNRIAWISVAKMGHELGNHSLFHPCRRDSINPAFHLRNYNMERYFHELKVANHILMTIDKRPSRTFAYPCSQFYVGPLDQKISIKPIRSHLFAAGRSYANGKIITPENIDFDYLPAYSADITLKDFDAISGLINKSIQHSGWIILVFHDISDKEGYLHFSKKEHEKLIDYLARNRGHLWIDTIFEISSYIRHHIQDSQEQTRQSHF